MVVVAEKRITVMVDGCQCPAGAPRSRPASFKRGEYKYYNAPLRSSANLQQPEPALSLVSINAVTLELAGDMMYLRRGRDSAAAATAQIGLLRGLENRRRQIARNHCVVGWKV